MPLYYSKVTLLNLDITAKLFIRVSILLYDSSIVCLIITRIGKVLINQEL